MTCMLKIGYVDIYMDSPLLFPTRIGKRVSASNAHWTVTVLKGYFKKLISPFLTKLTLFPPSYLIKIFTHLKVIYLDTVTHNFKWVKIPLFILINANQSKYCVV